jgi:hypothetical protein
LPAPVVELQGKAHQFKVGIDVRVLKVLQNALPALPAWGVTSLNQMAVSTVLTAST